MFTTDRLLFLELHKTGSSHVRKLLSVLVGGERQGKHNRPRVIPKDRFVVGSVRNPWHWYVSLWSFGCSGQGGVFHHLTRKHTAGHYAREFRRHLHSNAAAVGPIMRTLVNEASKPTSRWQYLYSDSDNPDLFREWLHLLLDPARRLDVGEGYAFSPAAKAAGLMTYRYIKLYARDAHDVFRDKRLGSRAGIERFDAENNVLGATIRTECLEQDLISALEMAGYQMGSRRSDYILGKSADKTNQSRHKDYSFYYDPYTEELVYEKERFLIDKYRYAPPSASTTDLRPREPDQLESIQGSTVSRGLTSP